MKKRVSREMFEIARITFKIQITYRFEVVTNVITVFLRVFAAYILWGVVYQRYDVVAGMNYSSMLKYYIVSSYLATLDQSTSIAYEISDRVKGGSFSKFMVLPINPQLHFLSSVSGAIVYYAIFDTVASLIAVALFTPSGWAMPSLPTLLVALIMIPMSLVFMMLYHFTIGILSLKVQDVGMHIWTNIVDFCKGAMIPLTLLPSVVRHGLEFLPFQYAVFTPSMLLTGQATIYDGVRGLVILLVWTALMYVIGRALYERLRLSHEGVGL